MFLYYLSNKKMKFLHLTYHIGCRNDLEYVFPKLGHEIETMHFTDSDEYNIFGKGDQKFTVTYELAQKMWNTYQAYFETFDAVIVSDTCPLSLPFLQNHWNKPLLIWVCNRFCYGMASEGQFPEYYRLIRDIPNRPLCRIFGFTEVEKIWSRYIKYVEIEDLVIRPQGKNLASLGMKKSYDPSAGNLEKFYVPLYGNETKLMDLRGKLTELGVENEGVPFKHVSELLKYKGVVTIPYGWSTLTLFERMQLGIVVFVPSLEFITKLFRENDQPQRKWWFQPPFYLEHPERLKDSEWYCDYHRDIFIYFDNWEDLAEKIRTTDYEAATQKLLEHGDRHEKYVLGQWKEVLESVQIPSAVVVDAEV